MNSFKKVVNLLIVYINILFIIRVTEKCFKINNFSYSYLTFCFICGAFIYYLYTYLKWRKIYKMFLSVIILFIVSLIIYYYNDYFTKLIALNIKYLMALNDNIFNRESTFFYQYKFTIAILIPLISIILLNASNKLFSDFVILFNLSVMIFYWYYGYVDIITEYTFYFVLINTCTYSINNYMDNYKNNISHLRPVIYIIFFSIILSAVQSFLPKNIEGKYYSDNENGIIKRVTKSNKNEKDSYNLSSSGYSPTDKKLGGPVQIDSRECFKVVSDKPYYLRGMTKDYYDGFAWRNSEDSFKRVTFKNPIPTPNVVGQSQKTFITIYPTKMDTSTLFSPLNTFDITKKSGVIYFNKDRVFLSSKIIQDEYKVEFYDSFNSSILLSTSLIENIKYVKSDEYDRYLQLPPNITKRVYDLVKDITKNSLTTKDKIRDIYNYLNLNFPYSLNVSDIPEGREFLDYFLFSEKKGYCTYFATASTIMLRIAGIPTRYVEGFNMSYDKDVNGLYIVSNKNAHAWSEVLINEDLDIWAIFDATPSAFEEIERIEREEGQGPKENNIQVDNKDNKQQLEDTEIVNNKNNQSTNKFKYIKYLSIFISIAFIIRILYIILRRNNLIKSSTLIPLYIYILKRLKCININISKYEGEIEFVNNIKDTVLKEKMKDIVDQVCGEYYSETKLDSGIENKREYYYFIEKYLREKQGFLKYYAYKILR